MLVTLAKQLIKVTPDATAAFICRALAERTQPAPVSAAEQEAMAPASKLHYGEDNRNVAWSWGSGPLVIFVHGWGGRAAQMAPLAMHVAKLGFRVVAIDVTGHGDSPEHHTRWEYFPRDIAALSQSLRENVYAYVGHSAGGLTMMAARHLKGTRAQRYVCICAPSHPFPPIVGVKRKLDPREGVIKLYKNYLGSQFETTWQQLEAGCSYQNTGAELLLLYDETDRFVPHTEADKIKALCPGSSLIKTRTYSHGKILGAPEVATAVGEFLKP